MLSNIKQNAFSIWESADDLAQIKEIYGKNLSAGEFKMFVQMGLATGLNPFLREIWAVKYGDSPAQIFIGRDGYRKSAQRSTLYDYHVADAVYSGDEFQVVDGEIKHKYNLTNRGILVGAYCIVKRKGASRPSYVFVELKEYSTNKSLWATNAKPATMIKKVAEAQALKAAFQELFANTYHEYEQWQHKPEPELTRPGKGVQGLRERLGLTQPEPEKVNDDEYNAVTGEIIDEPENVIVEMELEDRIEAATNLTDLSKIIDDINKLGTAAEKRIIMSIYRAKQQQLSGGA